MIEFAFVLPLLLALLIGMSYYGYVFMLQSAVTNAAQQAANAATSTDPVGMSSSDYNALVGEAVAASVFSNLDWLPASILDGATGDSLVCNDGDSDASLGCGTTIDGSGLLRVVVSLNVTANSSPLLPQINLPPFGPIPPVPGGGVLTGTAEVTL
ncbi:MAG: TadE/TadG family type IV pilus assembly protein [Salinisphaeraceae bacterium]